MAEQFVRAVDEMNFQSGSCVKYARGPF